VVLVAGGRPAPARSSTGARFCVPQAINSTAASTATTPPGPRRRNE
jgi:hypothetical protein